MLPGNEMSNFSFLKSEFSHLYTQAQRVEELTLSDPRGACFYARRTLELSVHWLYEHDNTLIPPYQSNLGALIHDHSFQKLLPPPLFAKVRAIQKMGNEAAHSKRGIRKVDSLQICKELFHFLYWLYRTYTRDQEQAALKITFNPQLLNDAQVQASPSTQKSIEALETKFKEEREMKDEILKKRESQIKHQARTLEERELKLATLDSELAVLRKELAEAKKQNSAIPDTHDYSEQDTRKLIIDLLLREAGWVIDDNVSVEYPVTGMPNQKNEGFVDYVLWGDDGLPVAVVEAKRTTKDARVGQQQAKLYADCLEQMKGQRPVIFYTNGYDTSLWDDTQYPPRMVQGFYNKEELQLMVRRRTLKVALKSLQSNDDIAGRYYQKRVIQSLNESFENGRRKGLLAMATGTGKTRTAIALVDLLMRAGWVKRVLFLADRVALVKQAVNAFKEHLPDSSPVNLVTEKDGQGRVYGCTYPTMLNLIETMENNQRAYSIGHFDLVLIDEAHRSVYKKYGAIFEYFDSLLVGLTATPRDEVHHDTYQLFDLESGVPTDAYSLEEAVKDGFLVPPTAISVPLKFQRDGIHYDELSEEEKDQWESIDWGDEGEEGPPDSVTGSAVNQWLFNEDTVDKVLQHLMENGQKVEGGDVLGKTIIFAKNHEHALFIEKRFNIHYPHLKGHFARVIDNYADYTESLIDDFSNVSRNPQIAISVDMLDTGIDIPEIVNLVYFKIVRSKTKFLQMMGRGTRLCPDLFGPDMDKASFTIFDFCGNLEYFNSNPEGVQGSVTESLSTQLFKNRLHLLEHLQSNTPQVSEHNLVYNSKPVSVADESGRLTEDIVSVLHNEVTAMNVDNFIVRTQRRHVDFFKTLENWQHLDASKYADLYNYVAGLPAELEKEHVTAKLFDLTCLKLQLAVIEKSISFSHLKEKVQDIAKDLSEKESIPMVREHMPLILDLLTEEYWADITVGIIEQLRVNLRDLVKFTDKKNRNKVYTSLKDQMGEGEEVEVSYLTPGINLAQYRKKVEQYIKTNESHITIHKLKHNQPLTKLDLEELERFLFESGPAETHEQFDSAFGDEHSLSVFIRSLVGLDRAAAVEAFSKYLDDSRFNTSQIRFVEMIIDYLTQKGIMEPGQLYEQPFTGLHYEGLDGVFPSAVADEIVNVIERVNRNAGIAEAA